MSGPIWWKMYEVKHIFSSILDFFNIWKEWFLIKEYVKIVHVMLG